MTKIPPTITIEDTNFANAWARAIRYIIRDGVDMVIGDHREQKPIRDICATISLTGDAIKQIENRELHPDFPFRFIDHYCEEFTRYYQAEYAKLEEDMKFTYTYFDRFTKYFGVDQFVSMSIDLAYQIHDGISSNRNQIITWDPCADAGSNASPCLQSIWCRYLGDHKAELHWHFRSRDGFSAWQANVIALTYMMNKEVIKPNGCQIVKIVDHSDSLHIYESDMAMANKVKLLLISLHGA